MKIKKKQFYRSRKGVTLVELVVAMTIIVIVFAGVVSGIAHGYATTLNNVTVDKASAKSQSITDDILTELKLYNVSSFSDLSISVDLSTSATILDRIKDDIKENAADPTVGVYYVANPADFTNDTSQDPQFTLIDSSSDIVSTGAGGTTTTTVKGCIIKTAVLSSEGFIVTTAFYPYSS